MIRHFSQLIIHTDKCVVHVDTLTLLLFHILLTLELTSWWFYTSDLHDTDLKSRTYTDYKAKLENVGVTYICVYIYSILQTS